MTETYYSKNREKILARQKIYAKNNKEKIADYQRKYWIKNKYNLKLSNEFPILILVNT
tara:strand:+ start:1128 stop:1301 length:174 start_codon:yes stop_codon:yes gene_type:complete